MMEVTEVALSPELNDIIAEAIERYHAEKEAHLKANLTTNADRIRAMSDEQLALAIRMTANCDLCQIKNCKARHYSSPNNCERHWLQWLQSPAEGGDHDA